MLLTGIKILTFCHYSVRFSEFLTVFYINLKFARPDSTSLNCLCGALTGQASQFGLARPADQRLELMQGQLPGQAIFGYNT